MIKSFIGERPIGSDFNNKVLGLISNYLSDFGYLIKKYPLECFVWKCDRSFIRKKNSRLEINPNPFSEPFLGSGKIVVAKNFDELEKAECQKKILLLMGDLTKNPLQPKNYPFYFPEEHEKIISILEKKQPGAIIAVTGKSQMSGCDPFPFFEDGNFSIPSASVGLEFYKKIEKEIISNEIFDLEINSSKSKNKTIQIVASKKFERPRGKIVIAAHMDTKYKTPGALDNASGLTVLLKIAKQIKLDNIDIDIVPFNSEEYFSACGELEYLKIIEKGNENISLMINIDSPCHLKSKIAVSSYNFDGKKRKIMSEYFKNNKDVAEGAQWYAGDHAPFVFRGIPCVAITSSDLFEGALKFTHTPKDVLNTVDIKNIDLSVKRTIDIISKIVT